MQSNTNETYTSIEQEEGLSHILMRVLSLFAFVMLPFAIGAIIMSLIVLFFTNSLSFVDYYHVLSSDYSFTGLWSIGYFILSILILIITSYFLLLKPRF